jgi:Glycogen recognition site of AMP-activated protein kinase
MPVEPDDNLRDERLRRIVAELRRPVRLDPAVDREALRVIRQPRPTRRYWRWGALTAAAAGLLVAVLLRSPARSDRASPAVSVSTAGETRPVRLQLAAPSSSQVAVVGDFNDWDPAATPLQPTGKEGVWSVELHLKPGRYHYTFLIDGRRWERDPSESPAAGNDFGAPVSVLMVS